MKKEKKETAAGIKPPGKKTGIAIFTLIMLIMGVIIACYHNPLADPADELVKKIIACVLITRVSPAITVLAYSLSQ